MTDVVEVSALTAISSVAGTDLLYIIDVSQGDSGSRKVTVENLIDGALAVLQLPDMTLAAGSAIYLGDSVTNGSYRVRRDSTYSTLLKHETRVSGSWITREIEVLPSGDVTGVADAANIAAAFSAVASPGRVFLPSYYYLNASITIPAGVVVHGGGSGVLDWQGASAANFMIVNNGRLWDIKLDCQSNCRAVQNTTMVEDMMRNVTIVDPYGDTETIEVSISQRSFTYRTYS